ncbi:hypothetical protein H8959_001768 [Pygathrix nigripes]
MKDDFAEEEEVQSFGYKRFGVSLVQYWQSFSGFQIRNEGCLQKMGLDNQEQQFADACGWRRGPTRIVQVRFSPLLSPPPCALSCLEMEL